MEHRSLVDVMDNTIAASKLVTLGISANTPLCSKARNRVALRFVQASAGTSYVFPTPMTATSQGIQIIAGKDVILTLQNDGDLVRQEWHGFAGLANNVLVFEVFSNAP